jgi:hypothetical protein
MNIPAAEFLQAKIFRHLPVMESLDFSGIAATSAAVFSVRRAGAEGILRLRTVIAAEEEDAWRACCDLLDASLRTASASVRGLFGWEIFSIGLGEDLASFRPENLARLLANHAAKLGTGQRQVVRYGQIFGVLHKRVAEDWGKMDWKAHVTVLRDPSAELGRLVRRELKELDKAAPGAEKILAVHDAGGRVIHGQTAVYHQKADSDHQVKTHPL